MNELFVNTSNWENVKTKNWAVAGGETIGLGAVFGGEAKIMVFTHQDLKTSKGLLMISGSVGAKLEANLEVGLVAKLLGFGGHAKTVSDATGVNPLNFSPPANVYSKTAFCLKDLEFANVVSIGVGATGGVVDTGVSGYSVHGRDGTQLFTMDEVTVQATIGAGINMGTLQGGRLINLRPTALSAAEQASNRQARENIPWEYSPSRRPAGGF